MSEKINELEVVERHYPNTSYSSTYEVTLLFSIRKRKFVKPVLKKHLQLYYRILVGKYIMFNSWGYRDANDYVINIFLVEITRDETKIIKGIEIHASKKDDNFSVVNNNPIISDFISAIPPYYHAYPPVNYDKIYSEEDVNYLLNLLNQEARRTIYLYEPEG